MPASSRNLDQLGELPALLERARDVAEKSPEFFREAIEHHRTRSASCSLPYWPAAATMPSASA